MRALLPSIALALTAMPMVAQQQVAKPAFKPQAATPAIIHKTPATLSSVLPAIDSVKRASVTPGPAAEAFLLNGEAVRVRGRNLGTASDGSTLGLRSGEKIFPLRINSNVARTPTEIGSYMPGGDELHRAGMPVGGQYEVVLLDRGGKAVAARRIELRFRTGQSSDLDRDGSTIGDGDCNDFDAGMWPGGIEIADRNGVDEDCDPRTFGARDLDGDHFFDAAAFNVDTARRQIYRGDDCDDQETTANPIRPENCAPGTAPYERDAALRRRLGWPPR